MIINLCVTVVMEFMLTLKLLSELYGFTAPPLRCSSHACDGTLKRLARSKTMCVDEVKELHESLAQ